MSARTMVISSPSFCKFVGSWGGITYICMYGAFFDPNTDRIVEGITPLFTVIEILVCEGSHILRPPKANKGVKGRKQFFIAAVNVTTNY